MRCIDFGDQREQVGTLELASPHRNCYRNRWEAAKERNSTFSKKRNDPAIELNLTDGERAYMAAWPSQKRAVFAQIPCAHCYKVGTIEKMKPPRSGAAQLKRWSSYLNLKCTDCNESIYKANAMSCLIATRHVVEQHMANHTALDEEYIERILFTPLTPELPQMASYSTQPISPSTETVPTTAQVTPIFKPPPSGPPESATNIAVEAELVRAKAEIQFSKKHVKDRTKSLKNYGRIRES